jgi:hypothetical protein
VGEELETVAVAVVTQNARQNVAWTEPDCHDDSGNIVARHCYVVSRYESLRQSGRNRDMILCLLVFMLVRRDLLRIHNTMFAPAGRTEPGYSYLDLSRTPTGFIERRDKSVGVNGGAHDFPPMRVSLDKDAVPQVRRKVPSFPLDGITVRRIADGGSQISKGKVC